MKKTMQFRARLAQVNGTSPRSEDAPNVISIKLEPQQLLEADWLFGRLGTYLVVDLDEAPAERTPLEQAIEEAPAVNGTAAYDEDEVAVPSAGRRRQGTRSSEHV